MGVRIDDAGGDDPAAGVELALAGPVHEPDLSDLAPGDGHVRPTSRQSRTVHDDAVADHEIVGGHGSSD